jgi:Antitoxin FitA-like, ribbon-helix-helix
MPDILIRDVPDDVLYAIEANAARLGLSCNEYLRRELSRVVQRTASPVPENDLQRFASTFGDLTDPDIISQAWR